MTTDDLINGLKHTADDHPCCMETIEATIAHLEKLRSLLKAQMCWNCWQPISDAERERAEREWNEANDFLSNTELSNSREGDADVR